MRRRSEEVDRLVLAAIGDGEPSIADIVVELEQRGTELSEGTIYVALQRLVERCWVARRAAMVTSLNGRDREIGFYQITLHGADALRSTSSGYTEGF